MKYILFEFIAVATKDKKTQLRINPEIGKALAVIAKAEGMPGFELLECICIDWIRTHKPEVMANIEHTISANPIKKDIG